MYNEPLEYLLSLGINPNEITKEQLKHLLKGKTKYREFAYKIWCNQKFQDWRNKLDINLLNGLRILEYLYFNRKDSKISELFDN